MSVRETRVKLKDEHIIHICRVLAWKSVREGLVQGREPLEEVVYKVFLKVINEDIEKERAIDEEVYRLLKDHVKDIEAHHISYHKMFQKVKEKLAKEKGLVL